MADSQADITDVCCICLASVGKGPEECALPCGHRLHAACLWECASSGIEALCPYCRKPYDASKVLSTDEAVVVGREIVQSGLEVARRLGASSPGTYLDDNEATFATATVQAMRSGSFWRRREQAVQALMRQVHPIAVGLAQRRISRVESESSGDAETMELGSTSLLHLGTAVYVHVWESPAAALRLKRVCMRIWRAIAEHHLVVLRCPTLFTWVWEGRTLTAACAPRLDPSFPMLRPSNLSASGVAADQLSMLLSALGVPTRHVRLAKGQGNYLVVADLFPFLASLQRFRQFPTIIARGELVERRRTYLQARGPSASQLHCDAFLQRVLVPNALARFAELGVRNQSATDEALSTVLHEYGISFAFLGLVRAAALEAAASRSASETAAHSLSLLAETALAEMIGRGLKSICREALLRAQQSSKFDRTAAVVLDNVFRQFVDGGCFWTDHLLPKVREKFLCDLGAIRPTQELVQRALGVAARGLGCTVGTRDGQLRGVTFQAQRCEVAPCCFPKVTLGPVAGRQSAIRGMWHQAAAAAAVKEGVTTSSANTTQLFARAVVATMMAGLESELCEYPKLLLKALDDFERNGGPLHRARGAWLDTLLRELEDIVKDKPSPRLPS